MGRLNPSEGQVCLMSLNGAAIITVSPPGFVLFRFHSPLGGEDRHQ
jgi:hypothetical protein